LKEKELDQVEVTRELAHPSGNANEPITICALLTFAGVSVVTVGRLVERWMELRGTERQMDIVLEGYLKTPEGGKVLGEIAKTGLKVTEHKQPMDPTKLAQRKAAKT
jgi:hypothetical protein